MSRHIPKSVMILGAKFKVKIVKSLKDDEGRDLYGESVLTSKLIKLSTEQTPKEMSETLLHEIIHCILHMSGSSYLIHSGAEEALVRALEHGLIQTFDANILKYR